MARLCSLIRATKVASAAALVSLGAPVAVLAQDAQPTSSGGTAWTMAYGLVLMGVILGLLVVVRPSGRREREK